MLKTAVVVAVLINVSSAVVGPWGQCGGLLYTGDHTCTAGYICTRINDWFYQCIPGGTTTTSTRTSSTTSTTTTTSTSQPTTTANFVKTSGQKFTLSGTTYTVVGANAYWLAQLASTSDIDQAFADIAAAGGTTVRTWGFNEVTSPSGTYYQSWSGSTPTINYGANGLQKFDTVVACAKAHGIRLIVALTNNWADYGGMDVYVKQITGSQNHDYFYTNTQVINAYKNYVNAFVTRYKNEPTILAWELANEPRCKGSTGITSGSCTTTTITNWITNLSQYIKSIDSNHLVSIGDEGFGLTGDGSYPYTYSEGLNFATNLAISTVDFGTFHLYPESWGVNSNPAGWGSTWITNHANLQQSQNKPVILEEFGVTSNQATVYTAWWNTVVSSGLAGDLIWQAGSHLPSGDTPQDGFAVYPGDAVYTLEGQHATALKARG